MPKVIDYVTRFAFLREAAFALVYEEGLRGLTRQGIADQLGVSISTVRRLLDSDASLEGLAASQVVIRRRRASLGRRLPSPDDPATVLAAELLPGDAWSTVTELGWWRLLIDARSSVSADASPDTTLSLRDQFEVATYGYLRDNRPPAPAQRQPDRALITHVDDREREVVEHLDRVLALLEVPGAERDGERTSLRALVDGLTLAICLHGLTPEAAHETLSAHLDRLDRRSQPLDRAG